jgi:hypothetical protein
MFVSPGALVSFTNKTTDCYCIAEILLKVTLNTITPYLRMHCQYIIAFTLSILFWTKCGWRWWVELFESTVSNLSVRKDMEVN